MVKWFTSRNMDKLANILMRLARPFFLILTTIMLVVGWFYPDQIAAYFYALSNAPEWLANLLTIMILGLAVEKGISRPIKDIVEIIKGASDKS